MRDDRLIASLVIAVASASLHAEPHAGFDRSTCEHKVDEIARRHGLSDGQLGFALLAPDGSLLAGREPDAPMVPASNNKILTTAAALDTLGPGFTWTTTLYRRGVKDGSTLAGDLWVKGTGDPNISGRDHDASTTFLFERWATALKAAGITRVAGDLLLDDFAFDRTWVHPSWPEKFWSAWFGAETSALSLSDNCVAVQIHAPARPQRVDVSIYPETSYVSVLNNCMATRGRPRGEFGIKRHPESNVIYVTGNVRAGASPEAVWIPVHQPTLFFGTVLRESLERAGIALDGEIREAPLPDASQLVEVDRFTSRLDASVRITNKRSQNFYAEQILKTMGAELHGLGSFENGLDAVERYLSRCAGVAAGSYHHADGSGLSRDNRFSPHAIASVLRAIGGASEGPAFLDSLPISGVDGTLEKRMVSGALAGRVRAKTGYLAEVSSLSGYLERGEDRLPFSILINAPKPKPEMEDVEERILEVVLDSFR
ncbi:MAG: D-alanyl-D-alanine carboxypeptidase/D-alanyl-D-alanine-endopeptidase [Acidobacteriota bacterium]